MREEDRFDLKGERRRTEGRKRETKTKERKKVSLLRKKGKEDINNDNNVHVHFIACTKVVHFSRSTSVFCRCMMTLSNLRLRH